MYESYLVLLEQTYFTVDVTPLERIYVKSYLLILRQLQSTNYICKSLAIPIICESAL